MNVRVQKWGNSLAVRIPSAFASEVRVADGSVVDLSLTKDGHLVLVPAKKKVYSLSSLMAGVTRKNMHAEEDAGPSHGREAW